MVKATSITLLLAQFPLQQSGLGAGHISTVECIYSVGTVSPAVDLCVGSMLSNNFSEGTNIVPLLGEHCWANFAKHSTEPNPPSIGMGLSLQLEKQLGSCKTQVH